MLQPEIARRRVARGGPMPPGWHHGRLRALPDGYDDPDVEDDGWDDDEEDEDWDEEDEDEPDEETWQVGAGQLP